MKLFRRPTSPLAAHSAFRELYEHNRLPVFRYVYGLTGGPQEEAEDLTAETFLRAWKARHDFQGDEASATGWLIRIAKRLVIDRYRRTSQERRHPPDDPPEDPTPEQTAVLDEQMRFLFRLVANLPDEPREILALRYLVGWRVNEIAGYMGITENQVSVTIHRTISRLRENWMEADAGSSETAALEEKNHETNS
jgi:RNA polymerase sigma-70 factor (ECF subfamily)